MNDIINFLYGLTQGPWWVYVALLVWLCWTVYYNQKKNPGLMDSFSKYRSEQYGLQRVSEASGEIISGEEDGCGEVEESDVEASGDALVIAGAIHDLADAVREFAKVMASENGMDDGEVEDNYLDGSRK